MKCNICKCNDMVLFHRGVRDNPTIDVYKCMRCGLLQLSEVVVDHKHYESGKMHQGQYSSYSDRFGEESWESWKQETMPDDNRRANALLKMCSEKRVLDFGCGNGGFIKNICSITKEVAGVELDLEARRKLREEGLNVVASLKDIEHEWDVITMFQVIEHLDNPQKWLLEIYNYLAEDGILVIETPNADDALISLYNSLAFKDFTFWSEHLMLYNLHNLRSLMEECGYKVIDNSQIQRYPLSNHLYWLAMNKPGGHKKWEFLNEKELNDSYEAVLRENNKCDTLFSFFGR